MALQPIRCSVIPFRRLTGLWVLFLVAACGSCSLANAAAPRQQNPLFLATSVATGAQKAKRKQTRRNQPAVSAFRAKNNNNKKKDDTSTASSVTTKTVEQPTAAASDPQRDALLLPLLSTAAVTAVSCVSTWAMIQHGGLNAARASSVQGLVACALVSPQLSAASLAGAFAGMSGYVSNLGQATGLAATMAVLYTLESHSSLPQVQGLLKGRGGRLGTVAVVASLLYFALQGDARCYKTLLEWVNHLGGWTTVGGVLAAVAAMVWASGAQQSQPQPPIRPQSLQQTTASKPPHLLQRASKTAIWALLVSRFLQSTKGDAPVETFLQLSQSVLLMLMGNWILQTAPIHNKVVPMSCLGLASSFLDMKHTAPLCVGGLMGMSNLPKFGELQQRFEASVAVSMLLRLGGLTGIGGRLGAFTVLAITLASQPW